jgi:predicted RNA-binding protein with PUA-like domain
MKCEPSAYQIDDLERDGHTSWEGVRNFQARNYMRDQMQVGDPVLFYASNADPSGVTGLARISRAGYPDAFARKKGHKYFDPDSKGDVPTWYMVDIEFVENFRGTVPLEVLKATKGLENMVVTQKGSRLSVQPVTPAEYAVVVALGRRAAIAPTGGKSPATTKAQGGRARSLDAAKSKASVPRGARPK